MTYPIDQIAIIAPILFIVIMITLPVIGVFGGWKRAAFWGGGNLLFYIIGLIIWTLAGRAIGGSISSLLEGFMEGTGISADLSKAAGALAGPVFFLIVLFIGNIILLINYYAWYKRVVGLKKYKVEKKTDKNGNVTKHKVLVQKNTSKGYKAMSMVVGGVGLPLAMLPSTIAFTQAVLMTTTSANTRKGNDFVSNFYNGLMKLNDNVNWFSYYNVHAGNDFDALFAGLSLLTGPTPEITYKGETVKGETTLDVFENLFTAGFEDITGATASQDEDTIIKSVNDFTDSWNQLVDDSTMQSNIQSLLSSDQATDLVEQVIENLVGDKGVTITETNFDQYVDSFETILDEYIKEDSKITPIEQIPTTQESFDNMEKAIKKIVIAGDDLDSDKKEELNDKIKTLLKLVLNPVL